MELPEMPEEGYAILVTPENYDYLVQVCAQLGRSDYMYSKCKALNVHRGEEGKWHPFIIGSLPSIIFNRCTLITEEQLKQIMFIYSLEN